jgi:hypothetical protein
MSVRSLSGSKTSTATRPMTKIGCTATTSQCGDLPYLFSACCLADADPAGIHRPQSGRIQMRTLAAASTIHVTIAATQVNIRSSLKIVI